MAGSNLRPHANHTPRPPRCRQLNLAQLRPARVMLVLISSCACCGCCCHVRGSRALRATLPSGASLLLACCLCGSYATGSALCLCRRAGLGSHADTRWLILVRQCECECRDVAHPCGCECECRHVAHPCGQRRMQTPASQPLEAGLGSLPHLCIRAARDSRRQRPSARGGRPHATDALPKQGDVDGQHRACERLAVLAGA